MFDMGHHVALRRLARNATSGRMSPPFGHVAPEAPSGTADLRTLKRFLPYLWPEGRPGLKLRVTIALVLVLVAKAVMLVMPFAYKGAIDRMAAGSPSDDVLWLVVALVVAYAAARFGGVLFDNLRNAIFERVGQEATRELAVQVFRHLHQLPLRFHLERKTGSLTRTIERGTKSIDLMLYLLLFNLAPVVIELAAVLIIFGTQLGVELVVATVVMVAAYSWFTFAITRWRTELRRKTVDLDNKVSARAVDSLLNYETVKYFNAEAMEARRYARAADRFAEAAIKSESSLAWLNIGQSAITNLMMGGAMAFTVVGWAEGRFTPGDVVLVNTLLAQLFRPLDMLGMVYREVKQGLIDMEAMFALIDTPPEIVDAPGAGELRVSGGAVRFEDVQFSYEPRRPILKGVSFEVPAGTRTAIVGPSGAGKSTLARILFRFYDISGGRVTIDGQDIREVTQASLRAAIGIVPQDTVLFNDSIAMNIGYGREGAGESEIEAAARQAQIHDFITRLPDGYATVVGERGLKLSGGEKQRVAIARTLLKDPPLLILDEATSALDSATEAEIQDALEVAERGRTTLVIAHRLSTVVDADQILVMDGGRIVERGRHQELLTKGGTYAELWALQAAEAEASDDVKAAETSGPGAHSPAL
jgi:ABC-type transport system involved in Fe-S cluster assembly fused permease/ATPase subunit